MNAHGAHRRADFTGTDLRISVNGESVSALESDSVASALIAAGYRVFGTSPVDDSARGGFCFVGRCSDCLMVIDGQPGTMACRTAVRAGMRVETQHGLGHWGTESAS